MKNNRIARFEDLQTEELRIRKRLKKQEEELKHIVKLLPEEMVSMGIDRIVPKIVKKAMPEDVITLVIKKLAGAILNSHFVQSILARFKATQ